MSRRLVQLVFRGVLDRSAGRLRVVLQNAERVRGEASGGIWEGSHQMVVNSFIVVETKNKHREY